jgi:hypothetical protein
MATANSTLTANAYFIYTADDVREGYGILCGVLAVVPMVFWFLKVRGLLAFKHRLLIYKALELLVLTQLVSVTAGYDSLFNIECDPDAISSSASSLCAEGWSGNTLCKELRSCERKGLNCDFGTGISAFLRALSSWSGLMTFIVFWSYAHETQHDELSVTDTQVRIVNGSLFVNFGLWLGAGIFGAVNRVDKPCRIAQSTVAVFDLFTYLSWIILVCEWFIPNHKETHATGRVQAATSTAELVPAQDP